MTTSHGNYVRRTQVLARRGCSNSSFCYVGDELRDKTSTLFPRRQGGKVEVDHRLTTGQRRPRRRNLLGQLLTSLLPISRVVKRRRGPDPRSHSSNNSGCSKFLPGTGGWKSMGSYGMEMETIELNLNCWKNFRESVLIKIK